MSKPRGGQRPGAGRPKLFKARKDLYLILEHEIIGGEIRKPELVKVLEIGEKKIKLQTGNNVIILRFPEEGELTLSIYLI